MDDLQATHDIGLCLPLSVGCKLCAVILPCKSLTCVKFILVIFDVIVIFVRMILDESGSDYLSFWEGM
jgi:hypothetical protein